MWLVTIVDFCSAVYILIQNPPVIFKVLLSFKIMLQEGELWIDIALLDTVIFKGLIFTPLMFSNCLLIFSL